MLSSAFALYPSFARSEIFEPALEPKQKQFHIWYANNRAMQLLYKKSLPWLQLKLERNSSVTLTRHGWSQNDGNTEKIAREKHLDRPVWHGSLHSEKPCWTTAAHTCTTFAYMLQNNALISVADAVIFCDSFKNRNLLKSAQCMFGVWTRIYRASEMSLYMTDCNWNKCT